MLKFYAQCMLKSMLNVCSNLCSMYAQMYAQTYAHLSEKSRAAGARKITIHAQCMLKSILKSMLKFYSIFILLNFTQIYSILLKVEKKNM